MKSTSPRVLPFILVVALITAACQIKQPAKNSGSKVDSVYVDQVWAGHPVAFDMITEPPYQFVGYYDTNRVMTIAQRKLSENEWVKRKLDEQVGWDSHNSINMAIDSQGHLHVSGNMHVDSLVYFQSQEPWQVSSLERRDQLVGPQENAVTYPEFLQMPDGNLIFTYRDGSSGKGNQIFNKYNPQTGEWSRLLDEPLLDGQGTMNAYMHGPVLGPDGIFHLIWVWRDNPGAETNHDLSYARSPDLVNWFKSDGSRQSLPITYENSEIIDPVPVNGGMLNGNTVIGFDDQDRVVVTYHKFDEEGNTQIFNARLEQQGWQIYKTTDWDFRWEFGGWGSLDSRIGVRPVQAEAGSLFQYAYVDTAGLQKYILHSDDLSVEKVVSPEKEYPSYLEQGRSKYDDVHLLQNSADKRLYLLKWETLKRNRDRPKEGEWPEPSPLVIYEIYH